MEADAGARQAGPLDTTECPSHLAEAMVCESFAELVEDDARPGPTRSSDPLSSTECRSSRHVASRNPVVGMCSFKYQRASCFLDIVSSRVGNHRAACRLRNMLL
jgi:hypothetical protein